MSMDLIKEKGFHAQKKKKKKISQKSDYIPQKLWQAQTTQMI